MELTKLKGIGEKRAEEFENLGICTISDLINYLPRDYEYIPKLENIGKDVIDKKVLVKGEYLSSSRLIKIRKNFSMIKLRFKDEGSIFYATFFNNPFIARNFKKGHMYKLYGKVVKNGNNFDIANPMISKIDDEVMLKVGYNPIYPLSSKSKINQRLLRRYIRQALGSVKIRDAIPKKIMEDVDVIGLKEAYDNIHIPKGREAILKAKKRLDFDEFLGFNLSIAMNKKLSYGERGSVFKIKGKEEYLKSLPFDLTNAQKNALVQIEDDLKRGIKMNRLIQGDVGSGKTVIAQYALYLAALNGYQSVMLAPTKILAKQHYDNLKDFFDRFNIESIFLHSKMTKSEKDEAYKRIKTGQAEVIIGTHAVFSKAVEYHNLGLCVIDEQHRFGVEQRGLITKKGGHVHTLVMSATPIPRTLALSIYKDLDLTVVNEKPKGRKPIKTKYYNLDNYENTYNFALKQIEEGRQVYVVCPSIDSKDIEAVEDTYNRIKKEFFSKNSIEYIHGKMKEDEKDRIMEDFYSGKIQVLVSTTVIEVGIDNKNANVMIIEGADRFGLATLHQLRGRVGRGDEQSFCFLLSSSSSKNVIERLSFMERNYDGFEIALFDLKTRGIGDILGFKQSGKGSFDIYKAMENNDLFVKAAEVVEYLLEENIKENRAYLNYINKKYFLETKNITWN